MRVRVRVREREGGEGERRGREEIGQSGREGKKSIKLKGKSPQFIFSL